MASRRPSLRSVLPPIGVILGVAVVLRLAYDPWYLNYDTRYALLWAHDIWHGYTPEYLANYAPTPHPLWTALGSLALPFGDHADRAMVWLVLLSFGVLVWLTFQLGRELFNPWVGAVAALVVFSRPAMQRDVVLAYLDVPFEALVVGAVLLEVRRPRRGTAVLIVLLAAGLLRPEAWALSILYVAYLWRHLETRQRWRLSALAVLAPIIWILSDAIVAGDALHSLHGTAALADTADRRRSPGQVPFWTAKYFGYTLREPVIAALPVGLWFAYRRGLRSARLPLVVAGVLIAVFAVGPIFGLPLIGRYVRTPSILLALFYGLACFGWLSLAPSQARHRWAIAGWLCVAASLVFIPSQANMLHGLRVRRDRDSAFYGDLRSLAHAAPVRAAFAACPKITTTDHRPIPYLRWWLGGRPGSVGTVEHHASRQAKLFLVPRATQVPHHFYGVAFPHVPPPAGYRVLYRDRSFRLYAAPECFTAPPS